MKKCIILLSQSYLHYASEHTLDYLHNTIRLVLIINTQDAVHPLLKSKVDDIYYVTGNLDESLRPELDFLQTAEIIDKEINNVGSPQDISIFCQQEDNVMIAAKLREYFNITGDKPDMVINFRDKILMKKCVSKALPNVIPKHEKLDLEALTHDLDNYYNILVKKLGNKMLVKPTTGAGSFNVMIINELNDLKKVHNMILSDNHTFEYEIDEYISGKMYQCDSFILNGKIIFCGILELGCSNFDFIQGKPLSVFPVIDQILYDRIFSYNQSIILSLGFTSGSTHHEIFIDEKTDNIIFLEIAARVPGGLGVPFHSKNSDINLIDATLLLAADVPELNNIQPNMRNNTVSALLPVGHGKIISLNEPNISSEYYIDWYVKVGDVVDSKSLVDAAGVIIFKNNDMTVLRRDFEQLQTWIPVTCVLPNNEIVIN